MKKSCSQVLTRGLSPCECEMYDERGELFEYGEDAEQKINKVRLWRCIYSTK